MANLNRYKFTFGKKTLTLTTEHDNLFKVSEIWYNIVR